MPIADHYQEYRFVLVAEAARRNPGQLADSEEKLDQLAFLARGSLGAMFNQAPREEWAQGDFKL